MGKKKKVTMQDIADRLSVSKVTVSKALNGKEGVGSELKERICSAAWEMGYELPEPARKEQAGSIAVFLEDKFAEAEANFYLKCYQQLSLALGRRGYLTCLFSVHRGNSEKEEWVERLAKSDSRGVILLGSFQDTFTKEIKALSVPLVFMDSYDPDSKADCVVTENIYSTYKLTKHLLECGHKEIGFVGTVCATTSIQDRFLGYCRALMESGLPLRREWVIDDRSKEGGKVQMHLPETMPSAFVCNCDDTAYSFVKLLKTQGYRVPEDISIVGFDNDIYAELCEPGLTTVAVDLEQMALQTAERIVQKIERPDEVRHGVAYINGKMVYRDSVRKTGNLQALQEQKQK